MSNKFSYQEFTTRNIGFISEEEQLKLKNSVVLIIGVGGMGGTALECLARCGIGNFIITDIDVFEYSNLNRQIFSSIDSIGNEKTIVAKNTLLKINPDCNITILPTDWLKNINQLFKDVDIIINGCDDTLLTILLMRAAKLNNKTVIDAFASTLPSVYVVRPTDPRPEEIMLYPTINIPTDHISSEQVKECQKAEMIYVLCQSTTMKHVILKYAIEMLEGKRKRISFAPMVWSTGILMSYEAIKFLLSKKSQANCYGIFMNPWSFKFEKANRYFWKFKRLLVLRFLNSLSRGQS